MAIIDANNYFTTVGTPFAPTAPGVNIAPNTIDTASLGLPAGSGGGSTPGYNAGVGVNAGRDLGIGGEMWLEVKVNTSVAQAANSTSFRLVTDSTQTIATPNVLAQSSPLAAAALLANTPVWRVQLPASGSYLEFIGLDVNILTTAWTAGAVEAYLLTNIQASDMYLSGIAIQ